MVYLYLLIQYIARLTAPIIQPNYNQSKTNLYMHNKHRSIRKIDTPLFTLSLLKILYIKNKIPAVSIHSNTLKINISSPNIFKNTAQILGNSGVIIILISLYGKRPILYTSCEIINPYFI